MEALSSPPTLFSEPEKSIFSALYLFSIFAIIFYELIVDEQSQNFCSYFAIRPICQIPGEKWKTGGIIMFLQLL